jgi:hypothetical protein
VESGSRSDVSTFKAEDSTKTFLVKRDKGLTKQFWRVRRDETMTNDWVSVVLKDQPLKTKGFHRSHKAGK